MSDNRRRRKSQQSGGSDDLSDSYDELNATKKTQNSENTEDHPDSEYDTAGSESDTESQDKNQRESGDGQEEEKPQKELDDDEDRRNPQYIPKKGTFYEHDDRTADEVIDEAKESQPEREAKEKKVWKDKEDRWNHDRYNDEEQAPKSHAELIAVYGYDIRNEEGPPRARRRRKYGRGPNKYTRNWEDEDAYGKIAGTVIPQKSNVRKINRTGEEFPSLAPKDDDSPVKTEEQPVITSAWYSNKNKTHTNKTQNFPPLQQTQTENQKPKPKQFVNSQTNENKAPNERNNAMWKREPKNTPYIQNANETDVTANETEKIVIVKTTPRENKRPIQVHESVSLAASKSRGRGFKANTNNNIVGSRTIESKPKGRGPGPINIDNRRSNMEHEHIMNDIKHMNVSTEGPSYHHNARQNKHFYTQPSSQQHATVVPPRMQTSHPQQQPPQPQQQPPPQPAQPPPQQDITSNRPKRYSSLRQRPTIAEGPPAPAQPNYQPAPQHTYYPPPQAGSSRAVLESPGYPPGPYEQTPPVPAAGAPMAGQPVMPIPPGAQPTSYAPHAPPPFLVPTPQFIPSQTAPPSIINYVPGPNGPIFQPNYQGYNPTAVPPGPPPPQEVGLYQPQGCTYYSPAQQQQQQQQQPVPLRRPKAAIPILPPPDNFQKQANWTRNRNVQQSQAQEQQQQQQQHQMQQQQEQLVQQQLQQHHQQLVQQQQQEQQLQQELLKKQQQKELMIDQQQKQQEQLVESQQQHQQQLPPISQQHQTPLSQPQIQPPAPQTQRQSPPKQDQPPPPQQQHQPTPPPQEQQHQPTLPSQQQQPAPQQQQPPSAPQQQQHKPTPPPQEQQNNNNVKEIVHEAVTEMTKEIVTKVEPLVTDNSNVSINTKVDSELPDKSVLPAEKEIVDSEVKVPESIVIEAAIEQKESLSKIESVIPEVDEKITTAVEASVVITAIVEDAKSADITMSKCIIENNIILAVEEAENATKTAELVSGKSEMDCSIKESAVIEETAA